MARSKRQPFAYEPESDLLPGGKAHARRGELTHHLALKFVEAYPPGSQLTDDAFDVWARDAVGYEIPDPQQKLLWGGHVKRRHHLITGINAASTHGPRMWDSGKDTYEIVCVKHRSYKEGKIKPALFEVCPIDIAQTAEKQYQGMLSLFRHYIHESEKRMQGIPWHDLPLECIGLAKHYLYAMEALELYLPAQLKIQNKLGQDLQRSVQPKLAAQRRLELPPGARADEDEPQERPDGLSGEDAPGSHEEA